VALNDARDAGVCRDSLDEAVMQMRQLELAEMLKRAIDSANPNIVRVAIDKARSSGAAENDLANAEHAMTHLEVQKRLRMAVNSSNPDMVSLAISISREQDVGADSHLIEEAERSLPVLDATKRLRKSLRAGSLINMTSLCESLTGAKSCLHGQGGSDAGAHLAVLVAHAEEQLPVAKDQAEARDILATAVTSGGLKQLRFAICIAQHTGLEASEIVRAELLLRQSVAREALQEAVDTGRTRPLEKTISMAKAAGLPQEEVQNAEDTLSQLLLRRRLLRR